MTIEGWDDLNNALSDLGYENEKLAVPYFGWYWREVDFEADYCYLAVSPAEEPSWYHLTAEAQFLRQSYDFAGEVRFCQNNKWGYLEFKVEGEPWKKLVAMVKAHVANPTKEGIEELRVYMNSLAPNALKEERI